MKFLKYETAKRLKEAGYPQAYLGGKLYSDDLIDFNTGDHVPVLPQWENTSYAPLLHELIEACGDRFILLHKSDGSWTATGSDKIEYFHITRSTPEDAMAHLWLKLNKK